MMKHRLKLLLAILLSGLVLATVFFYPKGEGVTPLMIAAKEGDSTSVARMISEGHDLDARSEYRWTAMIFASWQGHEDVVRLLFEAGADADLISKPISGGWLATSGGYPETSAMLEALRNRWYAIAEYLIDQGVVVTATAFTAAGSFGTPELLERIVDSGMPINTVWTNQHYHRTALSEAAQNGHVENMVWLLDNGADPNISLYGLYGRTHLSEAMRSEQPEVVALLIDSGVDVDVLVSGGETALSHALYYGYFGEKSIQQLQIVELLLKNGANPDHRPSERQSSMVERTEIDIELGIARSIDVESSADQRERSRREVASNRKLLQLLQSYQNR
jgi:ankyrin repeat protein